ncbi:MAG: DUF1573 domain-containing protein [Chitinophagaceae bacterium]|nr:DUF1573 domain-containing protein [Chitinophagaceae bacterium]MCW5929219.1 DUF1573 domain-containing protein [Chitinophagaceae bacterium]
MGKNMLFIALVSMLSLMACQNAGTTTDTDPTTQVAEAGNNTEAPGEAAAPVLTSVQWIDSIVNKGNVSEGEQLEIAFRFKNTGSNPLVIKDVRPSCGCTLAEKPEAPVAPGKEGIIKTKFDTKGRIGNNHKTIVVDTNTEQGSYTIAFDVTVTK